MNLNKKLEKLGIVNVKKLNDESINKVAQNVIKALKQAFPNINMKNEFDDALDRLLNCNMYSANIIKPISKVNYIYENNSIYIDEQENLVEMDQQIIHECIHYLQDRRMKKNIVKKIGLCNFSDFKVYGIGMNEAAVQYISARVINKTPEIIERFGIRLKTITPNYYPFLTNLMEQIVYLFGEEIVVKSVFEGTKIFEDLLLNTFEENTKKIIKIFDSILDDNNKLSVLENEFEIKELQEKIARNYIEAQNIMFSTYFNKICPRLTTLKEVEIYETKAIYYKNIMGTELNNTDRANDFYEKYMEIYPGIVELVNRDFPQK